MIIFELVFALLLVAFALSFIKYVIVCIWANYVNKVLMFRVYEFMYHEFDGIKQKIPLSAFNASSTNLYELKQFLMLNKFTDKTYYSDYELYKLYKTIRSEMDYINSLSTNDYSEIGYLFEVGNKNLIKIKKMERFSFYKKYVTDSYQLAILDCITIDSKYKPVIKNSSEKIGDTSISNDGTDVINQYIKRE